MEISNRDLKNDEMLQVRRAFPLDQIVQYKYMYNVSN